MFKPGQSGNPAQAVPAIKISDGSLRELQAIPQASQFKPGLFQRNRRSAFHHQPFLRRSRKNSASVKAMTKAKADAIEIDWPSGQVDKLSNIATGQTLTIQEAKGQIAARPYGKK